jgi:hypothetical protein
MVIYPADAEVRELLAEWLEERNHVIVEVGPRPESWPSALAEHEPDLVLMPQFLEDDPEALAAQSSFPDCQFRILGTNEADWESVLLAADAAYDNRRPKARRFADERRFIIHDEAYRLYASPEKLHRPSNDPGWAQVAAQQEALFVLQLQTGVAGGHQRAKQYLSVLRRFHRQLLQECAYRLGHASYKVVWLREEIARWCTVLCHYIPDAEIAACPAPQNASPDFVYLHHEMPSSFLYPLICVLQFMPRPSVTEEIIKAATWSYTGQSEEELAQTSYLLFGINGFLAEIARSQIWCMDQFLAADSDFHRHSDVSRGLHRAIGATMEFWGWHYLLAMGGGLRAITSRVLTGETRVEPHDNARIVPTFRELQKAMRRTPTP